MAKTSFGGSGLTVWSLVCCLRTRVERQISNKVLTEENAVNLTYGFVGLQDNFDLEDFDDKRQDILNALVACCPRKTAP